MQHDEIAACIIKNSLPALVCLLGHGCEDDTKINQTLVLCLHVGDEEDRSWNTVLVDRILEGRGGWMSIRFKEQLDSVRPCRRGDGQKSVFPDRNVLLPYESENLCVETERGLLICHKDASDFDANLGSHPETASTLTRLFCWASQAGVYNEKGPQ